MSNASIFQHRDFCKIAEIISRLDDADRTNVANHFAHEMVSTNPLFDRDRFLRACGLGAVVNRRDKRKMGEG